MAGSIEQIETVLSHGRLTIKSYRKWIGTSSILFDSGDPVGDHRAFLLASRPLIKEHLKQAGCTETQIVQIDQIVCEGIDTRLILHMPA